MPFFNGPSIHCSKAVHRLPVLCNGGTLLALSANLPADIPGRSQHRLVDEGPANLLDLVPTYLTLGQATRPEGVEGHDLTDYLTGKAAYPRQFSESGLGAWRAVTDGRQKLIVGLDESVNQEMLQQGVFRPKDTTALLFDLDMDPDEMNVLDTSGVTPFATLKAHLLDYYGPN